MHGHCTRSLLGASYVRSTGPDTFKLLQVGGHKTNSDIIGWALVDAADYEDLSRYRWVTSREYVVAPQYDRQLKRRWSIYLHRYLMRLEPGDERVVDHINRDPFDNRRVNLRIVTRGQNLHNQGLSAANSTGYRGVKRHGNRWVARCKIAGREHHIGTYATAEEAGRAASAYRCAYLPYATD